MLVFYQKQNTDTLELYKYLGIIDYDYLENSSLDDQYS